MKIHQNIFLRIYFFLGTLFTVHQVQAQDAMFSQFYAAPLYLNPSLAGAETNVIVGVNYRTQWNKLSPYQTGQVSLSYPLVTNGYRRKHLGGVGAIMFSETAGENNSFKTYGFIGGGAYNLTFDKYRNTFIAFGLQAGIIQKKIDNLNWGSQYDPFVGGFNGAITPSVNGLSQVVSFPIVNAGFTFFYNSQKISNNISSFLGMAISNMNKPNESFVGNYSSRLPMLFKIHGGADYSITKYLSLSHNFLWMNQNGVSQINVGTYLLHKSHARKDPFTVRAGAWYRLKDSFIFLVGFSKSQLSIGFSYDLNASTLRYTAGGQGAYEVSLTYRIAKVKNLRRFSTPLL